MIVGERLAAGPSVTEGTAPRAEIGLLAVVQIRGAGDRLPVFVDLARRSLPVNSVRSTVTTGSRVLEDSW